MHKSLMLLAASLGALPTSASAQARMVVWHSYRGAEKAAFEKSVAAVRDLIEVVKNMQS